MSSSSTPLAPGENHGVTRIGWLRAAVLGANDGIVSTASLLCGVAASAAGHKEVLFAGLASLVAGAMSMAAGEYVSVSSQSDTERADLAREKSELDLKPEWELKELQGLYEKRGLDTETAQKVALQLTAHNALDAHARDELGISENVMARPIQAALTSAATFAVGAALPLAVAWVVAREQIVPAVALASLLFLALLGVVGAKAGGSGVLRPTVRVVFWGALAMAATALIGKLFGTTLA